MILINNENLPNIDDGTIYFKISELICENEFRFSLDNEIGFFEFQSIIPDFQFVKIADCVLNLKENFPESSQIKEFITGKDYDGPLVRYVPCPDLEDKWKQTREWVYCILYNDRVVKIGMTTNSLRNRFNSYISGSKKVMKSGQCSTTNFVISECNYLALLKNIKVEIYAYELPFYELTQNVFGEEITFNSSIARKYESTLISKVKKITGKEPILCGYAN